MPSFCPHTDPLSSVVMLTVNRMARHKTQSFQLLIEIFSGYAELKKKSRSHTLFNPQHKIWFQVGELFDPNKDVK